MKFEDIGTKIKTITGTTGSELIVVSIITSGLLIGVIAKNFGYLDNTAKNVNPEVFRILDSLAEQAKTTYTGTDVNNNPLLDSTGTPIPANITSDTTVYFKQTSGMKQSKADKIKGMKYNLNTASKLELCKLPNVGEKTAIAILEYRKLHPFKSIAEIKNIKGIGEKKYESMKEFIEVK